MDILNGSRTNTVVLSTRELPSMFTETALAETCKIEESYGEFNSGESYRDVWKLDMKDLHTDFN